MSAPRTVFNSCLLVVLFGTSVSIAVAAVQAPLKMRGEYVLVPPEYSLADWKRLIDDYAAQGNNFMCFWGSSLFRSSKYPEAFYFKDYKGPLLTHDELHELIRYSHEKHMKFYFAVGGFSWLTIDNLAELYPETKATGSTGMCPNNPKAHEVNVGWIEDLCRTFPETDGIMVELRDEGGPCTCDVCQTPIDRFGSQKYGQGELTFLKELARQIWRINSRFEIMTCIGYGEHKSHVNDVAFYQGIKELTDSRWIWLEVRGNWTLPGANGEPQPLTYFSPRMITWLQPEHKEFTYLAEWIRRAARENLEGVCLGRQAGEWGARFLVRGRNPYLGHSLRKDLSLMTFSNVAQNPGWSEEQFKRWLTDQFFGRGQGLRYYDLLAYLDELLLRTVRNCGPGGSYLTEDPSHFRRLLTAATPSPSTSSLGQESWREIFVRGRAIKAAQLSEGNRLSNARTLTQAAEPDVPSTSQAKFALVTEGISFLQGLLFLDDLKSGLLDAAYAQSVSHVPTNTRVLTVTSEFGAPYLGECLLDGDPASNWLCSNAVPLPQSVTVELPASKEINSVTLVQSSQRLDYNTRHYGIEVSYDGAQFRRCAEGDLPLEKGAQRTAEIPRGRNARFVRIVIDSIYPDAAFSSPALAEIKIIADHQPIQKLY